jgi:oxygen-independent coproporphyrinogen-3 oxidase
LEDVIPDYIRALCAEISIVGADSERSLPVHTLFFGGGTPSIIPINELEAVFEALEGAFELHDGIEVTLEANPERLSIEYLRGLKSLGVNRISLGVQSANSEDLRLLGRYHDFQQAANSIGLVRKVGFENLNIDLIFGLPNETMQSWQRSLEISLRLSPEHISLYALTLEQGTPLAGWVAKGLLNDPDQDLVAEMYEWAASKLDANGYHQYEISNWASGDDATDFYACAHNLQYWRNLPYLGLGAGAHGYAGGIRTANELFPGKYVQQLLAKDLSLVHHDLAFPLTPTTVTSHSINREEEMSETMIMGLRLTREGVSRVSFQDRFGTQIEEVFGPEIEDLIDLGLLEWNQADEERLLLTPRGRILGNQVFVRFI